MTDFCAYIKRNKRKFIYIGGIIGSSYAIYKIANFVQNFTLRQQYNNELQSKIQKGQYFQATINNSMDTVKNILKNLEHEVEFIIDSENVANSLGITINKSHKSSDNIKQKYATFSVDQKLQLWKKLKVLSFTKITLMIYCWSFISITIHIQMAILAGNMFQSRNTYSLNSLMTYVQIFFSTRNKKLLDEKFQLEFINFTLKQIQNQIKQWSELINKASAKIAGQLSLKAAMSPHDIGKILRQIIDVVHNDILEIFLRELQTGNRVVEVKIFDLFSTIIESSGIGEIKSLMNSLCDQVCSFLDTRMRTGSVIDGNVPLAKLIPFMWNSFVAEDAKMLQSLCNFSCDAHFRHVLFNVYDSSMTSLVQ